MFFGKKNYQEERAAKITRQVREAIAAHQHAEANLNEAVAADLVDAAVFELRASELRLNYLLRIIRQEARQEVS